LIVPGKDRIPLTVDVAVLLVDERSELEYRRALDTGAPAVRVPALTALAARAKRSGDYERALVLWEQAADQGDPRALRELAMHHEHRRRDYPAALAVVERSLGVLDPTPVTSERRFLSDLSRRRRRLLAKLSTQSRSAESPPDPGSPPAW